jgi:hypothetical protein
MSIRTMGTKPHTRLLTATERRLGAQVAARRLRPPPDPTAWFWFRCQRCTGLVRYQGIALECDPCVTAARAAWPGMGPIRGECSGA